MTDPSTRKISGCCSICKKPIVWCECEYRKQQPIETEEEKQLKLKIDGMLDNVTNQQQEEKENLNGKQK